MLFSEEGWFFRSTVSGEETSYLKQRMTPGLVSACTWFTQDKKRSILKLSSDRIREAERIVSLLRVRHDSLDMDSISLSSYAKLNLDASIDLFDGATNLLSFCEQPSRLHHVHSGCVSVTRRASHRATSANRTWISGALLSVRSCPLLFLCSSFIHLFLIDVVLFSKGFSPCVSMLHT